MKAIILIVLLGYPLLTLIYSSNALECYQCGLGFNLTDDFIKIEADDCDHPKKTGSRLDLPVVPCPYGSGCSKVNAKYKIKEGYPGAGKSYGLITRNCLRPGEPQKGCHKINEASFTDALEVVSGEFCGCEGDLCNGGNVDGGSKKISVLAVLIVYVMSKSS